MSRIERWTSASPFPSILEKPVHALVGAVVSHGEWTERRGSGHADSLGERPLSEAGWCFLRGSREAGPGIDCDADGAFGFLAHLGRLGLRAQSAALDSSYPLEVVVADRPIADLALEIVPSGVIRLGRARAADSGPWADCRVLSLDGRLLGALLIPLRPGDDPDELRVPAGPCRRAACSP